MPSNVKRTARVPAAPGPARGGVASVQELIARSVDTPSIRRLLQAAVDSFWKDGFHASSTRDIAKKAKLSPAAVYVHFRSKEELLYTAIWMVVDPLQQQLVAAVTAGGSPTERLRRMVSTYVAVPARLHKAAHVANSEFGSLTAAQRRHIISIRDRIEDLLEACLIEGVESGEFRIGEMSVVKMALISLCQSVLAWYQPRGRLTPEEIGRIYAELALAMVTARRLS